MDEKRLERFEDKLDDILDVVSAISIQNAVQDEKIETHGSYFKGVAVLGSSALLTFMGILIKLILFA